jgi:hypothetical protein
MLYSLNESICWVEEKALSAGQLQQPEAGSVQVFVVALDNTVTSGLT